jgi:hypothetical protein
MVKLITDKEEIISLSRVAWERTSRAEKPQEPETNSNSFERMLKHERRMRGHQVAAYRALQFSAGGIGVRKPSGKVPF